MTQHINGLQLGDLFYHQAVRPILDAEFPRLAHSAAIIGSGSEVLGLDDATSRDHHWGPRVMLFLGEQDCHQHRDAINGVLRRKLPHSIAGYPTNFTAPDPQDKGTQLLAQIETGPVNHRVEIYTLSGFFGSYMGFDIDQFVEPADWLTFPQQKLRSIVAGQVYHDDLGLAAIREKVVWYPHDVWLYLLAAGWQRIAQEEHLMGRAGLVGDELGSAIIAARLVRDVMNLCFLMQRQYAPYAKWFGTAFAMLPCAQHMAPALRAVVDAPSWQQRQQHLATAFETIAAMHNDLGLTELLPATVSNFHDRPLKVIHAQQFADALHAAIGDPVVARIAQGRLIGGIDQISDNTDILCGAVPPSRWRALYG